MQTQEEPLLQEVEDADQRISIGLLQVARTTNDGNAVDTEGVDVDVGRAAGTRLQLSYRASRTRQSISPSMRISRMRPKKRSKRSMANWDWMPLRKNGTSSGERYVPGKLASLALSSVVIHPIACQSSRSRTEEGDCRRCHG